MKFLTKPSAEFGQERNFRIIIGLELCLDLLCKIFNTPGYMLLD